MVRYKNLNFTTDEEIGKEFDKLKVVFGWANHAIGFAGMVEICKLKIEVDAAEAKQEVNSYMAEMAIKNGQPEKPFSRPKMKSMQKVEQEVMHAQ